MKSDKRITVLFSVVTVLAFMALPARAFYNASTGRWSSRDPIGEAGRVNFNGFIGNCPIDRVDEWGLLELKSAITASSNLKINYVPIALLFAPVGATVEAAEGDAELLLDPVFVQ